MTENSGDLGGTLNIRRSNSRLLMIAAGVILVLAGLAGFFAWNLYGKKDAAAEAKATTERITEKVKKLYLVPAEQPTVAQIDDKEKLKSQPFFNKAANGDYLLVFQTEKLALLYREKENILINVSVISSSQDTPAADTKATTPTAPQNIKKP